MNDARILRLFFRHAIFHSRASVEARELRHIIENEAI